LAIGDVEDGSVVLPAPKEVRELVPVSTSDVAPIALDAGVAVPGERKGGVPGKMAGSGIFYSSIEVA
jgi:hypothetical protein